DLDREQPRVAGIEFKDRWRSYGVASDKQRPLKGPALGCVLVKNLVTADIKQVSARGNQGRRKKVMVQNVIGYPVTYVYLRQKNTGHVEHMTLVGERVRAIAMAVGRIRQQEVTTIDVILFRRIVDSMRPGVSRVELVPFRETLLKCQIRAVVVGFADGFRRNNVGEAGVHTGSSAEDRASIGEKSPGGNQINIAPDGQPAAIRI